MKRVLLAAMAGSSLAVSIARCETRALTPEEVASAVRTDNLTIPTPGEFFAAMDAVGRPAWGQMLRSGSPSPADSRTVIALTLGTLVADGYIAVEAQDGQAVKNIGKEIISLAKKLNVNQSVLGRAGSINDFADNSDWNALREELEATQNEVKLDMAEQKDNRLVALVSLGAWIRGVELISGVVAASYTADGAKLLRQPAIMEYLVEEIDALPAPTRETEVVSKIRAGLVDSLGLVADPVPSAEQVQLLNRQMKALQTIIEGRES